MLKNIDALVESKIRNFKTNMLYVRKQVNGVSVDYFSKVSGVSTDSVYRIEVDSERYPNFLALMKVVICLGVSLDKMLDIDVCAWDKENIRKLKIR